MNFTIRPAEPEDAADIQRIRLMPGVIEWILALNTESAASIRKDITDPDVYMLVAVDEAEKLVGYVKLSLRQHARQRHKARLSIAVDTGQQGLGAGSKLLAAALDCADRWLKLMKVDLTVQTDNACAIKLYERFGFVREGLCRYECVSDGKYVDVYLMARYHLSE